jgi:hypothetical protein
MHLEYEDDLSGNPGSFLSESDRELTVALTQSYLMQKKQEK